MLDDFVFGVGDLIHQPPLKWRDPPCIPLKVRGRDDVMAVAA
jgi:hypothetical protein